MPLPNYIKDTFEWINPTTTLDNDYCGAYNSLLRRAFPIEDGYMINPQVAETISSHDDEFVMYFRVEFHRTIVFFAEVGTAIAIKDSSARATADDQTRLRLSQLSDKGLTELHGMSALGTRLRFYRSACLDGPTKSLTPPLSIPYT
ncbi:hypothetical protein BD779DRAFT_1675855 [Infundibulicybe gibba]|nr:hypothetical protein BD779DRAFT_1675855 [Infundibulicybe gibba]